MRKKRLTLQKKIPDYSFLKAIRVRSLRYAMQAAGTGEWLTGERFRSGASEETVKEWVESLPLK